MMPSAGSRDHRIPKGAPLDRNRESSGQPTNTLSSPASPGSKPWLAHSHSPPAFPEFNSPGSNGPTPQPTNSHSLPAFSESISPGSNGPTHLPTDPSPSPPGYTPPSALSPTITLRGISKIYKGILGINNITLDIFPGISGLLGPNGAGKSTILKVIAGLVRPSSGKVRIFGEDPRKNTLVLSHVGYCPEHDAFYPDMTGKEFVAHFLRIRGFEQRKAFRMADLILRRLDMSGKMDRRIGGYSRGMKQKIKVAAAVVHNPDLLILDEPLQGTDPEARHILIRNMKEWAKEGMTIVVSSHILNEIERMTKRVVLINEGRVYAVGEMDQIRALMVNRPLTIRITPKDPEGVRALASILVREPSVTSVTVENIHLIVHTLDAREFYTIAPKLLSENSIAINEFMPVDDDLENLYYYLMNQRRW